MFSQFKMSGRIFMILILVLVFIASNAVIVSLLLDNIENDARLINYSGIVRGSIQRIVKLENASSPNDETDQLIDRIDQVLETLYNHREVNKFKEESDYINSLNSVRKAWIELKALIAEYRKNPIADNEEKLIKKSEELWHLANNNVYTIQFISESKIKYFQTFFFISFINLVLILLIFLLIKWYVRDKLEYSVNHDFLTGIWNRKAFNDTFHRNMKSLDKKKETLVLIMLDIDHFKRVNDTYGHDQGDIVLTELAKVIKGNIRKKDFFARIGGEEFLIMAPETDLEGGRAIAEKLRREVEEYDFPGIGQVTISLGVSEYEEGDSPMNLMKKVDNALYEAKENGRNRVETI